MTQPPKFEEEKMQQAKASLQTATIENVVERCQKYLKLLDDYRDKLYKFRGSAEINRQQKTDLSIEAVHILRKQIRRAVEQTTSERNKIEDLIKSFVAINGYDAAQTFNRLRYKGFDDWALKAGGVHFGAGEQSDVLSIQEAVATAGLLRREEYVANQVSI